MLYRLSWKFVSFFFSRFFSEGKVFILNPNISIFSAESSMTRREWGSHELELEEKFSFFMCRLHTKMLTTFYVSFTDVVSSMSSLSIHITTATLFLSVQSRFSSLIQFFWDSKKRSECWRGGKFLFCNIHEWKHAESLHPTTSLTQPHFLMKFIIPLPCFERNYFCSPSSNASNASCMYMCASSAVFFEGISRMFVNRD